MDCGRLLVVGSVRQRVREGKVPVAGLKFPYKWQERLKPGDTVWVALLVGRGRVLSVRKARAVPVYPPWLSSPCPCSGCPGHKDKEESSPLCTGVAYVHVKVRGIRTKLEPSKVFKTEEAAQKYVHRTIVSDIRQRLRAISSDISYARLSVKHNEGEIQRWGLLKAQLEKELKERCGRGV